MKQTIRNALHHKGVELRKRPKAPKMSPTQHQMAQEQCRILANRYFSIDAVVDDKSYFLLKDDNVKGNNIVWTRDNSNINSSSMPLFLKKESQSFTLFLSTLTSIKISSNVTSFLSSRKSIPTTDTIFG